MKGFCLVVGLCVSPLLAAGESGYFVGGGFGIADVGGSKQDEFNADLNVVAGSRIKVSEALSNEFEDDTSVSYRLFGGYRFNQNIGIQLSLFNFGEVNVTQTSHTTYNDGSTSEGTKDYKLENLAVSASGVFSYPINDQFSLFSTLGIAWSRQEERYSEVYYDLVLVNNSIRGLSSESYDHTQTTDHVGLAYGLGAAYSITKALSTRIEFNGIELDEGRILDVGLSLVYSL